MNSKIIMLITGFLLINYNLSYAFLGGHHKVKNKLNNYLYNKRDCSELRVRLENSYEKFVDLEQGNHQWAKGLKNGIKQDIDKICLSLSEKSCVVTNQNENENYCNNLVANACGDTYSCTEPSKPTDACGFVNGDLNIVTDGMKDCVSNGGVLYGDLNTPEQQIACVDTNNDLTWWIVPFVSGFFGNTPGYVIAKTKYSDFSDKLFYVETFRSDVVIEDCREKIKEQLNQ